MKKEMTCVDYHIVKLDNPPAGVCLGKLSDQELAEIMEQCHYFENKACYTGSANYISREIAGELVLVPLDDLGENGMVTFNQTGAFLWKLLEKKRTVGDLVYELQREFDVSREIAEADVKSFLDSAVRCGMVEII